MSQDVGLHGLPMRKTAPLVGARPGRLRRRVGGAALVAAMVLPGGTNAASVAEARSAGVGPQERCTITQITANRNRFFYGPHQPSLSGDGSRLAYIDDSNSNGDNPDHLPLMYLYDVSDRTVAPVPSAEGLGGVDPSISANGSSIVYSAGSIFRYDTATDQTIEVSSPPDLTLDVAPATSADARVIAWVRGSTGLGRFTTYDVMLSDLTIPETVTLAAEIGPGYEPRSLRPDVSPDGTKVAYLSTNDPTGENPEGHLELFLHDRATGTTIQATPTTSESSITLGGFVQGGSKVVFGSDREYTGPNPDREHHRFMYDVATGAITRMSDLGAEGSISRDGSRIAYGGTRNVDGANPDEGEELFSFDIGTEATTQLTSQTAGPGEDNIYGVSSSSEDGTTLGFLSNGNLTGANPNHRTQLFLATTCGPPPRPDAAIAVSSAGPFAGDDVYSSIPIAEQKQTSGIAPGQTRTFFVQIQNDRSIADSFKVHGVGSGSPGYRVLYRQGRTDITAAVRAGTFRTEPLEPGAVQTIKIKITATTARSGSGRRVDLTARSTTNPVTPDTVRAKVTST